jgi:competence protein ComEA
MLRSVVSLVALLALAAPVSAQAPAAERPAPEAAKVINLNTATAPELETLPGIGPAMAARIVEYRTKSGPFKRIEEIMNIQGIGERVFLRLRSQITVGPPPVAEASR